jgi:hypothetical protein
MPTATVEQLKALTTRQQSIVLDGVRITFQWILMVETPHRKSMLPNSLATWELRLAGEKRRRPS